MHPGWAWYGREAMAGCGCRKQTRAAGCSHQVSLQVRALVAPEGRKPAFVFGAVCSPFPSARSVVSPPFREGGWEKAARKASSFDPADKGQRALSQSRNLKSPASCRSRVRRVNWCRVCGSASCSCGVQGSVPDLDCPLIRGSVPAKSIDGVK